MVHVSFPEKDRPAEVRQHYNSMTSGEVRLISAGMMGGGGMRVGVISGTPRGNS